MIFDRIYNTYVEEAKLPNRISLGRYLITETNEELCSDNLPQGCDVSINDAFLGDTYSTTHKILRRLTQEINGVISCKENLPSPIIRNVCDEIKLTEFEAHLFEHINHIKAAFENPHSKLNRIEEKVNVSKAKRITPRSYQYLGAHTEDWQQYSIISFRPEKVLTEELSQDYDIYENRLLVAFVQRTLAYLRGRLKSVEDAMEFIKEYRYSLQTYQKGLSDDSYWYAKPERNLQLFGREYHDQNYVADYTNDDETKSDLTYRKLHRMMNECVIMLGKNLVQEVNQRTLESITYHDTNVLIGHPHYKYVKSLWADLNNEIQDYSIKRIQEERQKTIKGLVSYANALVKYIVIKYFHYTIQNGTNNWTATYRDGNYTAFPQISVTTNRGTLELCIGHNKIRIVTIVGELKDTALPSDCVILKYNMRRYNPIKSNVPDRIIDVNLKDVDSVERLSMFIRSILIGMHVKDIKTKGIEPKSLDFLHPEYNVKMYSGNKNYLMMNDNFVLNISDDNHEVLFSNMNPRLKHLKYKDWGMDNIFISNYLSY